MIPKPCHRSSPTVNGPTRYCCQSKNEMITNSAVPPRMTCASRESFFSAIHVVLRPFVSLPARPVHGERSAEHKPKSGRCPDRIWEIADLGETRIGATARMWNGATYQASQRQYQAGHDPRAPSASARLCRSAASREGEGPLRDRLRQLRRALRGKHDERLRRPARLAGRVGRDHPEDARRGVVERGRPRPSSPGSSAPDGWSA